MNILVINCGSSSIKYQVMDPDRNELLCKGLVELSGDTSTFAYTKTGSEKTTVNLSLADHTAGVEKIIATITDPEVGCIKDLSEIGRSGPQNGTRRRGFRFFCSRKRRSNRGM